MSSRALPMPLSWLRLYTEARNDRKLATLDDAEFRVWFNLLCYAAEREPRGRVTVGNVTDVSVTSLEVSRNDPELFNRTVDKLIALAIVVVEDNLLTFLHFDERQNLTSESTERVRRWREKRKPPPASVTVTPEMLHVTPSNARNTVEEKRSEENREENKRVNGAFAPVLPEGERRELHARFSDCWEPTDLDTKIDHLMDWLKRQTPAKRWSEPYSRGISASLLKEAKEIRDRRARQNGNARSIPPAQRGFSGGRTGAHTPGEGYTGEDKW